MPLMTPLNEYNKQANIITLSKDDFSLLERRISYLVINHIEQSVKSINQNENIKLHIPISELNETNTERIKKACREISKKQIEILNKDNYEVIAPFPQARYEKGSGLFEITILADILPYFVNLHNSKIGYTQYHFKSAMSLRNVHSQRIYELLSRFRDTGKLINYPLHSLRTLLNLEQKYTVFQMFKTRVLDTVQKELSEKTDIAFQYETHKTSKRITHISFSIILTKLSEKYKVETAKINYSNLDEKSQRLIGHLNAIDITDQAIISDIIKNKSLECWKWLSKNKENDKLNNKAGALLTILGYRKAKTVSSIVSGAINK